MTMIGNTGQLVITRGINGEIADNIDFAKFMMQSLKKYMSCDWGDICDEDKKMNDNAVKNNDDRIVARYNNPNGDIYIITEWDRSATTVLFTYEY